MSKYQPMNIKTNLSRRTQLTPRPRTVGEGRWQQKESLSTASRFAWLIAGFNLGVGLLFVLVWLVLPLFLSGFSIKRNESETSLAMAPQRTPTATITLTSLPSETPFPTATDSQAPDSTIEDSESSTTQLSATPTDRINADKYTYSPNCNPYSANPNSFAATSFLFLKWYYIPSARVEQLWTGESSNGIIILWLGWNTGGYGSRS